MAAVTSIMRAQQILTARLNQLLDPRGLTFARYEALMLLYLSRTGSLPLGTGARLQVHPTSVTNAVDGLTRPGFVRRQPQERDRRTVLASITDEGREAAKAATASLNQARFGTKPLDDTELESIFAVLRRLRQGAGDFAEPRVSLGRRHLGLSFWPRLRWRLEEVGELLSGRGTTRGHVLGRNAIGRRLVLPEETAGNALAVHLVRAVVDACRARVSIHLLEWEVRRVTETSVGLERAVDDVVQHHRAEVLDLGNLRASRRRSADIDLPRGLQRHEARRLHLGARVRDPILDRLVLAECLAMRHAIGRALAEHVEGTATNAPPARSPRPARQESARRAQPSRTEPGGAALGGGRPPGWRAGGAARLSKSTYQIPSS
jgi:DNA-binding MarR family transcriptional regulator